MRALANRLQRLETRLKARGNSEAYSLARILCERRRRRLEQEGVPADQLPPLPPLSFGDSDPVAFHLSLAETLRQRRQERLALSRRAEA